VWPCAGDDGWISVVARTDAEWRALCAAVPALSELAALSRDQRVEERGTIDAALTAWARSRSAADAAEALRRARVPAAALARSGDLVRSPHLAARGFWDKHGAGVLPGLPWRASFGRTMGLAPGLGADSEQVLADVLGFSQERITALKTAGVLG
jgi:crotonobetainyl-CoA:carnitine CoA-transferase CaiB-like acyl-CoA transferase